MAMLEVLDIMTITETKLYHSFLQQKLPIEGFDITFILGPNTYGRRLLFY